MRANLPPYLTTTLGRKRCSECGAFFDKKSAPSLREAFADHIRFAHEQPEAQQFEPMTLSGLFSFASNEIALASSFADMAADGRDPRNKEKRQRCIRRANEGYKTALDLSRKQPFTPDDRLDLERKLELLRAKLDLM